MAKSLKNLRIDDKNSNKDIIPMYTKGISKLYNIEYLDLTFFNCSLTDIGV